MSVLSFLAGLFLGSCSSNNVTHNHNTTTIRNPIQYPDDWDDLSDEEKLKWLRDRSYWHEFYELKGSLYERVEFKLVEGDNIYFKVMDSIIKNNGDKTEAEKLFTDYLNKRYRFKVLNDTTKMEIQMEFNRMNDYIRHNYSLISHFNKSVEDYYFNLEIR